MAKGTKKSQKTKKKVVKKAVKKSSKRSVVVKAKSKTVTKKRVSKSGGRVQSKVSKSLGFTIGDKVSDFELKSTGGSTVKLSSLSGKKVVLYFYPKDMTPGCTLEGHDFTRLHPEFQKLNCEVFGVSRDTLASHEKFKSKENYCFDLLSDEKGEVTEKFGVWIEKSMYGRTYMGIERSTFLIDESGHLTKEWRSVKVNGHAEDVLNFVKGGVSKG